MLTRTPPQTLLLAPAMPLPWTLYSWPPVFWQANSRRRLRFVHLGTQVNKGNPHQRPSGHTVWSGLAAEGDAGLAWDWVEITCGVFAMADPMGVVTNMQLLDADGEVLPASAAALHFNQFVRGLPWQEEVRRLLQTA